MAGLRRDVYIENDSGGFSVVAGAAVDAIVEAAREDDMRHVTSFEAMLLELYGDDSMPVRIVAGEPLTEDEQAQWLARATWRIDAPDGRVLVMGGFDPDVLTWWRELGDPDADGRGVAVARVEPGSWRVDLYAHAGSMNGRHVLDGAGRPLGEWFRASHPGRPFPVWLAHHLEHSGDGDPGHEALWSDVPGAIESGALAIDAETPATVGFLVHLTPFSGSLPDPPEAGWFGLDDGARVPDRLPAGLPAAVTDPNAEWFLDRALRRERPDPPAPPATEIVEVVSRWEGDPTAPVAGGPVELAVADAFHAFFLVATTADSPPAFEFLVSGAPGWSPPPAEPEFGVVSRGRGSWSLGTPPEGIGWYRYWGARAASPHLVTLPDGATLELATAAPPGGAGEDGDPAVGRARFGGTVTGGTWRIDRASPAVAASVLADALAFVRALVEEGAVEVRGDEERAALEQETGWYGESLAWDGDRARLAEEDPRTILLVAQPVFRMRFGEHWPCDVEEEDDDW